MNFPLGESRANRKEPNYFRLADHSGATRKASNPPLIHVELGVVNLHSSELKSLP